MLISSLLLICPCRGALPETCHADSRCLQTKENLPGFPCYVQDKQHRKHIKLLAYLEQMRRFTHLAQWARREAAISSRANLVVALDDLLAQFQDANMYMAAQIQQFLRKPVPSVEALLAMPLVSAATLRPRAASPRLKSKVEVPMAGGGCPPRRRPEKQECKRMRYC